VYDYFDVIVTTQQQHIDTVYGLKQEYAIENVNHLDGKWIVIQLNLYNQIVVQLKMSQPCTGPEKQTEQKGELIHCCTLGSVQQLNCTAKEKLLQFLQFQNFLPLPMAEFYFIEITSNKI